tara:strand:+ start:4452 stop:4559 length:108 start_codon:yes stop_codon:yes gene_type:complete
MILVMAKSHFAITRMKTALQFPIVVMDFEATALTP